MDKELKAKWIKALRSGQYKQARRRLLDTETGGMCCLGVLAKIQGCDLRAYGKLHTLVTEKLPNGYGAGLRPRQRRALAARNDGSCDADDNQQKRHTFKQIADYIEKNL